MQEKPTIIPEYPHFESIESLVQTMEISKEGLSTEDAQKNLSIYGYNEIKEKSIINLY